MKMTNSAQLRTIAKGRFANGEVVTADRLARIAKEYDRLAEENAELREFAKYCQGFLGCEETRDSMALHGITIKAKELLNK